MRNEALNASSAKFKSRLWVDSDSSRHISLLSVSAILRRKLSFGKQFLPVHNTCMIRIVNQFIIKILLKNIVNNSKTNYGDLKNNNKNHKYYNYKISYYVQSALIITWCSNCVVSEARYNQSVAVPVARGTSYQ